MGSFTVPQASILVGAVLMGLAFVLELVGLVTPGWCALTVGEKGEVMMGLWEFCYELPNFTCENLEQMWAIQGWMEACRAMGVLAVLVMVGCLITIVLLSFLPRFLFLFAAAPWCALSAGLLIYIQFAIFVGEMERTRNSIGRNFYYEYAFVLTVVAFVFSLFASVFLFIGESRNRNSQKL
ncbi:hypothetical protein ACOMHN_047235 [Nucella lapillus]